MRRVGASSRARLLARSCLRTLAFARALDLKWRHGSCDFHAPPLQDASPGQEALYLRSLSDRQVNVQIKLRGGETVRGWIEYFDDGMLRLTREDKPNLFIYKQQISTITEVGRRTPRAARTAPPEADTLFSSEGSR